MALPEWHKDLVSQLLKAGFRFLRYSGNNHPMYRIGDVTVTLNATPGDPNLENIERQKVKKAIDTAAGKQLIRKQVKKDRTVGMSAQDIDSINERLNEEQYPSDEELIVTTTAHGLQPEAVPLLNDVTVPNEVIEKQLEEVFPKEEVQMPKGKGICPECGGPRYGRGFKHKANCSSNQPVARRSRKVPKTVASTTNGHAGSSISEMCDMFEVQLPIFFKNVKMLVHDLKQKNEMLAPFMQMAEKLNTDKRQKMYE